MSALKVCVYAICKNEAQFVERWMASMREADLVVVTDTGSTDDTVDRLRAHGAVVHEEKIEPWRFDVARNASLANVPLDVDICVCTDLDEYFESGWREQLERAWRAHKPVHPGPIARTGRYLYNWSLKPDGSPDVQFTYFKVHDRIGFRWKCPVHEFLQYEGELPHESTFIPGMVLNHAPDPAKSRGNYLPLLEMAVREEPEDERMAYYLGREYLYAGQWDNCIKALEAYLKMPKATWDEERGAAMRWIAQAHWRLAREREARIWYFRAIAEALHMRDGYVEFARLCYQLGDWPMTLFLTEAALAITAKSGTYINMGYAWDETPSDLAAIAAYRMGLLPRSLAHARAALAHAPQDARLKQNLEMIERALAEKTD